MEFENLYDNFEREVNFEENINIDYHKKNSIDSESYFKENNTNNSNTNNNSKRNSISNSNPNVCNNNNNNFPLRKKSSIINPFGSFGKTKKEEVFNESNLYENNYYNNINENDDYFNENLVKRKSSILGILESSVIKKRNSIVNISISEL